LREAAEGLGRGEKKRERDSRNVSERFQNGGKRFSGCLEKISPWFGRILGRMGGDFRNGCEGFAERLGKILGTVGKWMGRVLGRVSEMVLETRLGRISEKFLQRFSNSKEFRRLFLEEFGEGLKKIFKI
jgi:hypothetical protein